MPEADISVLLKEKRIFKPSQKLVSESNVKKWMDKQGIRSYEELMKKSQDTEWFWGEAAKEFVEWYSPPKKVLDWKLPYSNWFVGAKYNIVHDAVDRHAKRHPDKVAYYFEGEPGDRRKMTYKELSDEVCRLANALKKLGLKRGDRVSIYLPMILELPVAMLACAKIGVAHSVVFSGFSSLALADRINDCGARVLITCDTFWRRGKTVALKAAADEAARQAPSIEHVVVVKRTGENIPWTNGRDLSYQDITANESTACETEKMEANDLLYILYTSGTTGKPKGVMQRHGGYAVNIALTLSWVFDLKDNDIWWGAADAGWVTGHSYIVYAPLILGTTSIIYEGAPDWPEADRWWDIIENYKVTVFYTSPTAIRMFMKLGTEWVKKHDLSSLRLLGSVGEPINPEAWIWYQLNIGGGRCQIMDTWWQTETGAFAIAPLPISELKPGSAVRPLPGMAADIYTDEGKRAPAETGGNLVLLSPWPAMLGGLYKNPEKYQETYWAKYPGVYLTGDIGRIDADGYYWVQGRADDVLKVSGHRLSNSELESSLVSHMSVSEAAVIGKPHELKGESIVAFVILKKGIEVSEPLRKELREHVGKEIGKIAMPDEVWFVADLPKTRSGKIMRRVIRKKVIGEPVGDISTLMNPEAVAELDKAK
jgi:acetyl-CoA synthetase